MNFGPGLPIKGKYSGLIRMAAQCVCAPLICSCNFTPSQSRYPYQIPEQTDDSWQTASLEDVGMDTGQMEALMNDLSKYTDHWLHGMVVIKDGKLDFEAYFPGEDLDLSSLKNGLSYISRDFDQDTLHSVASVSISVTSRHQPCLWVPWWLGNFPTGKTETYFAAGYGGQFIFVLPALSMVMVFTGGGFEDRGYDAVLQIMNQYILPAAVLIAAGED